MESSGVRRQSLCAGQRMLSSYSRSSAVCVCWPLALWWTQMVEDCHRRFKDELVEELIQLLETHVSAPSCVPAANASLLPWCTRVRDPMCSPCCVVSILWG